MRVISAKSNKRRNETVANHPRSRNKNKNKIKLKLK
jgi:hypothetical protein